MRGPPPAPSPLAAVLLALLVAALPAEGQEGSGRLEVMAVGGAVAPLGQLTSDPETFATEVSTSLAYGGSLAWWLTPALGASAHVLRAPAELNVEPTEFIGAVPNDLGSADYLAAVAGLTVRLRPSGAAAILEPFASVAGGVRRLEFDPIAEPEVTDSTDPVLSAAAGVYVRFYGGSWLRLELRDYLSRFESASGAGTRTQHDVAVTVGLGVRTGL